jgi:hypothetical protein
MKAAATGEQTVEMVLPDKYAHPGTSPLRAVVGPDSPNDYTFTLEK